MINNIELINTDNSIVTLKELVSQHMTQAQLAKKLRISRNQLGNMLSDRSVLPIETLLKIMSILNLKFYCGVRI